jgi:hypothetical protein
VTTYHPTSRCFPVYKNFRDELNLYRLSQVSFASRANFFLQVIPFSDFSNHFL